jgi:putative phage-type endonuclease
MKIITDMVQGSELWHQVRLNKVTASRMSDVLSKGRGTAPSKTAESYMMELIAEKLTGQAKPFFENDAMKWGTETEPQARAMYELNSGNDVIEVAFIEHSEFIGVSPDGLIGSDGMIEIKCPTTITQIRRALSDNYSKDYTAQIQMQLWVAEREWCDFLSFDPRLDVDASYLLQRVYRDEKFITEMEEKTNQFIETMNELIIKLTK